MCSTPSDARTLPSLHPSVNPSRVHVRVRACVRAGSAVVVTAANKERAGGGDKGDASRRSKFFRVRISDVATGGASQRGQSGELGKRNPGQESRTGES